MLSGILLLRVSDPAASRIAQTRERKYKFLVAEKQTQDTREPARAVEPLSEVRDAYKGWFHQMLTIKVDVLERQPRDKLRDQIEKIGREISLFRNSVLDKIVPYEFFPDVIY